MERPERPTRAYLAEFAWAFLLINGMAAGAGWLVGAHMDSVGLGLALFLGLSLTVTLLLAIVVAGSLAWDAWVRARSRRRGQETGGEK